MILTNYFHFILCIHIIYTMDKQDISLELNHINPTMYDESENQNEVENIGITERNVCNTSMPLNYITTLIKTIVIKIRSREIITDDINEMSKAKDKEYRSVVLPEEVIELHSKSEEDICAICYHKFSRFPCQKNAKGTLKIKTDNKNHDIHCNILCTECIKHMIEIKENCPYCREPIDIPEKVNIKALAIARKEKIKELAIDRKERISACLFYTFHSIKESHLFNKIKESSLCKCIGLILMVPAFFIASPFVLLVMVFTQFIIFEGDDMARRESEYFNRIIYILNGLCITFGIL